MIRKDNGSNNSLILSCQMGLPDGAFFMIKHTPLPNGNHPIMSPVCPMRVADTLELCLASNSGVKNLKRQNRHQKSCCQMSPKSNVLALNIFNIKDLEVKHPASKVWATNVLGIKQLESQATLDQLTIPLNKLPLILSF